MREVREPDGVPGMVTPVVFRPTCFKVNPEHSAEHTINGQTWRLEWSTPAGKDEVYAEWRRMLDDEARQR